jgi:glutamine amidotransferase
VRVTLLDLGIGNLHSLAKAIARSVPEAHVRVDAEAARALGADLLVLPGVGAFGAAAEVLAPARERVRDALLAGHPCLGICLGMQLFFDESDEGPGRGLGVMSGRVTRLRTARLPHMGWSPVLPRPGAPAWPWPSAVYYAHSFAVRPADPAVVLAETELDGDRFPAIVRAGSTVGCQFHPEKSSAEGTSLLGAIVRSVVRKERV